MPCPSLLLWKLLPSFWKLTIPITLHIVSVMSRHVHCSTAFFLAFWSDGTAARKLGQMQLLSQALPSGLQSSGPVMGSWAQVGETHPFHVWKQMGLHYNPKNLRDCPQYSNAWEGTTGRVQTKVDSERETDKRGRGPSLFSVILLSGFSELPENSYNKFPFGVKLI